MLPRRSDRVIYEETPFDKTIEFAKEIRLLRKRNLNSEKRRLIISSGGRVALAGIEDGEVLNMGITEFHHRDLSINDAHDRLLLLGSRDESEMRVYKLEPSLKGESIEELPGEIDRLQRPFQGGLLASGRQGRDGLFAGSRDIKRDQFEHIDICWDDMFHQSNSSAWLVTDYDSPKDSFKVHRLDNRFGRAGTVTLPKLERRYVDSVAASSDMRHLVVSCSEDDSVLLFKVDWE